MSDLAKSDTYNKLSVSIQKSVPRGTSLSGCSDCKMMAWKRIFPIFILYHLQPCFLPVVATVNDALHSLAVNKQHVNPASEKIELMWRSSRKESKTRKLKRGFKSSRIYHKHKAQWRHEGQEIKYRQKIPQKQLEV